MALFVPAHRLASIQSASAGEQKPVRLLLN
jgi:hypothetical protein